jgi:hypothetical protein
MSEVSYGSIVLIRDLTPLDGRQGTVIRINETTDMAEVLLDKEIIWPVKTDNLELVS